MMRRPLSDAEIALLCRELALDGIEPAPFQARLWRKGWLLPPPLYAWMRFAPDMPAVISGCFMGAFLFKGFEFDGLVAMVGVAVLWAFNGPEAMTSLAPHRRHLINAIILMPVIGALIYVRSTHPMPAVSVFFAWLQMAVFFAAAVLVSGLRFNRRAKVPILLMAGLGLLGIWQQKYTFLVIAALCFVNRDAARDKAAKQLPRWPDYVEQALVTEAF